MVYNMDQGSIHHCKCQNVSPQDSQDNNTSAKKNANQLIKDFSSYTTVHGLHFIMDSGALLRRILWGILICFSVCFLTVQVYFNLQKLLSRQVTISKSLEFSETLPFPAVTICNQNMMRKSQIMGTIAQDYLDQMDPVKIAEIGVKSVPSFDVEKTIQRAGHQIDRMMQECSFPGITCSKTGDFPMTNTLSFMYGLCYTFNGNTSTASWRETSEGQRKGLKLKLNAEPYEYYGPFSYDATGFKVAVHEPGTFHDIENKGYDVPPGFYTSIRIRRAKFISEPYPYPSKCATKKLLNFEEYNIPSCLAECKSIIIAEQCKCRQLGMVAKGIGVTRFCNSTETYNCVRKALKDNINEKCDCPPKCESIQYNIKTSIAYYPSEHSWKNLIKTQNTTGYNMSDPEQLVKWQALVRKTYAAVAIFYESTSTDVTEEKPNYNLSELGKLKSMEVKMQNYTSSDNLWQTFKPSFETNDKPKQESEKSSTSNKEQKLIEDFGSYTTLHGFHFILDSGSIWRRTLWVLLIILGLGLLIAQIYISLTKLYANEFTVRKSVEVSKSLPFPAVTICNQNMMRKSQIMGTIAQDYLDQLDSLKLSVGGLKQKEVPSFDVEKMLEKTGHQLTEMVHLCEFTGEKCSAVNDFTPALSSYSFGLCYTFNANGSSEMLVGSGKRQGFTLQLDTQPEEYYGPYSYDATGFKVAIHEPGTYHDIDNEGYDVPPGFYTSIRIKRTKTISLKAPYETNCSSIELENFAKYSQSGCFHTCISKKLVDECNCRVLSMVEKGINVTRFCNTTEIITCIFQAFKKSLQDISPVTCGCPQECEAINYNVKTSIAYYPSAHLWDTLLPVMAQLTGLNASDPQQKAKIQTEARKRIAVMTVFYENLLTDVTEEKPSYGVSQLGSDIGGNMGLFLGCSLLTICEFIDLIIMVCLYRWKKKSITDSTHNGR
ncbi:Acid-sensing ion channel 4 [Exaiptasia diaphana]|nr:Acid-sensing ion channel 4 [Exaiptasia diaphana]